MATGQNMTGWTPAQVKSLIDQIKNDYTTLGGELAANVRDMNTAISNCWVGVDSLRGRQVLAAEIDGTYRYLARSINGVTATLYGIAGYWEQNQKNTRFSTEGGSTTNGSTNEGEVAELDLRPEGTDSINISIPEVGDNEEAEQAWMNISNGLGAGEIPKASISETAETTLKVNICSICTPEEVKVEISDEIKNTVESMSDSFYYASDSQFGFDTSAVQEANSALSNIVNTFTSYGNGLAGLAVEGPFSGTYTEAITSFLSEANNAITTMCESVTNFGKLIESAQAAYEESSSSISTNLESSS